MQRVSSFLPSWERRNSGGKGEGARSAGSVSGNASFFGWGSKTTSSTAQHPAALKRTSRGLHPINIAAANADRIQREAFWPATLDLECDKAARILKSFCVDGYLGLLDSESHPIESSDAPTTSSDALQKIPKRIIQNAAGIAIFTCMRNGLWMTGSGGSGILIARKSDGTWSPPSGIMLHTPTLSFIIGVDIYDCVLVVSNPAVLECMTRPRVTLGEDVTLKNGPVVPLSAGDLRSSWKDMGNAVLAYMKSRGQEQTVNLNGCILTERGNENERFYGNTISQMDILAGNVARHVEETTPLFEVIKMAEGRSDFDQVVIDKTAVQPAPGDALIETPKLGAMSPPTTFGVPKADDPDPFGVLALEMAGLEIREAGSRLRPGSKQLEYHQGPLSPALSKLSRQSMDTSRSRSNRESYMSTRTVKSQVSDAGTQTDTRGTSPSPPKSHDDNERNPSSQAMANTEILEVDYTTVDLAPLRHLSQDYGVDAISESEQIKSNASNANDNSKLSGDSRSERSLINDDVDLAKTSSGEIVEREKEDEEEEEEGGGGGGGGGGGEDEEEEDDDEEPVVFEVAAVQPARTQAVASRMIPARGNVVTIAKRIPPPLPKRSPARASRIVKPELGAELANLKSPLRQAFSEADFIQDDESEDGSAASDRGDIRPASALESRRTYTPTGVKQGTKERPVSLESVVRTDTFNSRVSDGVPHQIKEDKRPIDASSPIQRVSDDGLSVQNAVTSIEEETNLDGAQMSDNSGEMNSIPAVDDLESTEVSLLEEVQQSTLPLGNKAAISRASQSSDEQSEAAELETVLQEQLTFDAESETELPNVENADDFEDVLEDASFHETSKTSVSLEGKHTSRPSKGKAEHVEVHVMPSISADQGEAEAAEKQEHSSIYMDESEDDDDQPSPPQHENVDMPDSASNTKHTSSIYTGATEDRWSFDGSSSSTPTSDRPSSVTGESTEHGTPKKSLTQTHENVSDEERDQQVSKEMEDAPSDSVTTS